MVSFSRVSYITPALVSQGQIRAIRPKGVIPRILLQQSANLIHIQVDSLYKNIEYYAQSIGGHFHSQQGCSMIEDYLSICNLPRARNTTRSQNPDDCGDNSKELPVALPN